MGVVVRRYIDFLIILLIPTPLVLALFAIIIANVAQRTFEIVQKSRSCEHGDIIISTRAYVDCAHARVLRLPRARYRVTFQESCS